MTMDTLETTLSVNTNAAETSSVVGAAFPAPRVVVGGAPVVVVVVRPDPDASSDDDVVIYPSVVSVVSVALRVRRRRRITCTDRADGWINDATTDATERETPPTRVGIVMDFGFEECRAVHFDVDGWMEATHWMDFCTRRY